MSDAPSRRDQGSLCPKRPSRRYASDGQKPWRRLPSTLFRDELRQSNQIVGDGSEGEGPPDAAATAELRLLLAGDRLDPAEPIVNEALSALERDWAALYSPIGRPSIPPEKLLRAMLLQAFYSIRSERLLVERLEFDLLLRWFVGIGVDDAAWDHSVFSKNRDRLLEGDIAAKLLSAVLAHPRVKRLLSTEHFSVDGTLIEAWASMKSFKPKDGSDEPPADGGGRNRETDF